MKLKTLFLTILICSISYIHAAGQSDKPETPQRIVIAGRATIMLMDALYLFDDIDKHVVARGETNQGLGDFFPVIDSASDTKPNLGKKPGPEEILSHKPDLVILKNYMKNSLGQPLEDLGVNVLYLDLETEEAMYSDIRTLGEILYQQERAEQIITYFDTLKSHILAKTENSQKPKSLFIYPKAGTEGYSFQVPSSGWIQEEQIKLAGGLPVWTAQKGKAGWSDVSFEQIAAWAPEAVFITDYRKDPELVVSAILNDPLWAHIPAVEKNRVFAVPADFYSWGQADTRWILGAFWMAAKLHPQRFPKEESITVVKQFFTSLYGLSDKEVNGIIMPLVSGDFN